MTPNLRTLIVDDEPLARERLIAILQGHKEVCVVGEAGDGKIAVQKILELQPDLVFLDIQLPEIDGFGVIEALPANLDPAIIFVTAYDRFAVKAFEVHAVDYLLKPVEKGRLSEALDHVRVQLWKRGSSNRSRLLNFFETMQSRNDQTSHILLKLDGEILRLKPGEIDWVESAGNYACFHVGASTRILRETMNEVEQKLQSYNFVRTHRTAIVNLDRVRRLKPLQYGDYELELRDGTKLPLSRTYRSAVMKKLEVL